MKAKPRRLLILIALLALSGAVFAQDSETESEETEPTLRELGYGSFLIQADVWIAQPTGLEYQPATQIDPTNPFDTMGKDIDYDNATSYIWRVAYTFKKNIGEFSLSWWTHEDQAGMSVSKPGQFVFGETAVNPLYAGVNDDGLADGFDATTSTTTRDFKIAWHRQAFNSKRITGKWYVAARRVQHKRQMTVNYYAQAPNLPPLIPPLTDPRPDLDPGVDRGVVQSDYVGRGLGAGFDVVLPVSRRKLLMEAGLGLSVLRGDLTTRFTSQTNYYGLVRGGDLEEILAPPYDEFTEEDPLNPGTPLVNSIFQFENAVGTNLDSTGQTATVVELYLGFRWLVWKGLEVTFGYRTNQYLDVGTDVVSRVTGVGANGVINYQTVQETKRSANYEGAYVGLAYRF